MISDEVAAAILRLHFGEAWSCGTIASQLGVHRDTVRRVLADARAPAALAAPHPSKLDPYIPKIMEILTKHPDLQAKNLYEMMRERGYKGGPDHFRHRIAGLRPKKTAEAFLRLRTLPGEQAQVDWAHFGSRVVKGGTRKLYAFVMVLSYSRRIYLEFGFDIGMAGFLRGHSHAFDFFGGVVRVALYDNLKSAVLERYGDIIRFHPELLDLSAHYRYEARPVAVARGNEKGRVERAIQYVRKAFFAGREFKDLDDLNAQAHRWTASEAEVRLCPEDRLCTVEKAFHHEQPLLRRLPSEPYPTEERKGVTVGKVPYARFDTNDYSVPHTCVRRELVILASLSRVRIFDGPDLVAEHARSFDMHQQIENLRHLEVLREHKAAAHAQTTQDWLLRTVPEASELLTRLAKRQGSIATAVAQLARLLQSYGHAEFSAAVRQVLADTGSHQNGVRHVLEKRRAARGQTPLSETMLDNTSVQQQIAVTPHDRSPYDTLGRRPAVTTTPPESDHASDN